MTKQAHSGRPKSRHSVPRRSKGAVYLSVTKKQGTNMLDIRVVMGVVVLLFAYLAVFSEGDHSINLLTIHSEEEELQG